MDYFFWLPFKKILSKKNMMPLKRAKLLMKCLWML